MRGKFTKKLLSLFAILFITVPISVYSQTTGSIGGSVVDQNDGSPLPGATVRIDGTNLGAVTNDNGEYVILNISVGDYDVTASYIGYNPQKVTGVKVSVDLRTQINFTLTGEGIETEMIVVEAQRSGIDVEQSGRLIESQQIEHSGIRGITNIVSQTAGVITDERGQGLNIKGGRTTETIIIVDGVQTTNPITGLNKANVSNSMLQEIAVLTGGFGAEYGNVLSGVINVTTKSGSSNYSGGFEVITDEFSNFASTRSYGYNLYGVNLGGPLIPSEGLSRVLNIYLNFERQFQRVNNPSWISQNLEHLYPDGRDPNNELGSYSYNARLNINLIDIKDSKLPIIIRSGFSYYDERSRLRVGGNLLQNSDRNPVDHDKDLQYFSRLIHNVSSNFFYELQFNYFKSELVTSDPVFGDELWRYGNLDYNPNFVPFDVPGRTYLTDPATVNLYNMVGSVWPIYRKEEVSYIGGKMDATWAILTKNYGNHEIKFGGEYKYNTLRLFNVNASGTSRGTVDGSLGLIDRWYGATNGRLNAYGYDDVIDYYTGEKVVFGNQINPKNPIVAGFYARDKVSFFDFNFNGGVRVDYFDVNDLVLKDINNLRGADGTIAADDVFEQSKGEFTVSPRLGFSFPVTDRTIFIAQYGKMIQLPPLQYLYSSAVYYKAALQAALQDILTNSSLKPSKLTQYEVGFKQQVGDFMNFGVTAFYKESTDLIGTGLHGEKVFFVNNDFAIARGLDLYLSLRRMNRIAIDAAYTLSYSSGTGSSPTAKELLGNTTGELPAFVYPLDYDQRHTGSINFDYRFGSTDVPQGFLGDVLSNMGLNLNFTFNSGRPYTRRSNAESAIGSGRFQFGGERVLSSKNEVYSNWRYRVDLKLDKGFNVMGTYFNAYVYVINLLNTEIINNVFPATGLPNDNGYINTPTGALVYQNNPVFRELWQDRISFIGNWGPPRQIRFGLTMNF